jgi:hypothetical protein
MCVCIFYVGCVPKTGGDTHQVVRQMSTRDVVVDRLDSASMECMEALKIVLCEVLAMLRHMLNALKGHMYTTEE